MIANTSITASDLAYQLGLELVGDGSVELRGVAGLQDAVEGDLTFLYQASYVPYLGDTKASVVILKSEYVEQCPTTAIVADDPYLAYAKAAQILFPARMGQGRQHPSAVVGDDCEIAATADIGPGAIIGNRVTLGEGVVIGANCVIADGCKISAWTELRPNVTLLEGVKVGLRCLLHSGVVIGADGFGFANDRGQWIKIPQVGSVTLGNDVEVGANTTIDRGATSDTVIEDGVKLDNQIQLGHNVHVGAHTIMACCVKVAGSTHIGRHCMIAGGVGMVGHIHIADNATITAMSMITKSIEKQGSYSSGLSFEPTGKWRRLVSRFRQLDELFKRVKELERRMGG